jgi:lipopolysaccharide/colanic/teichoic acid biosynthesis glycosyltransferase
VIRIFKHYVPRCVSAGRVLPGGESLIELARAHGADEIVVRSDAEHDGRPRWATEDDPRVTRVGRWLRRLRIDELPQMLNVFRGEMSFVGPRPERAYFAGQLGRELAYYNIRHSIKPGITGLAQVRYGYGASQEDALRKLQYDLYYVKNHSLFLDLLILIDTAQVVLSAKGGR